MSINTLANLAVQAGLDNTLNENYIIKEFEETMFSTSMINEEVLHCDASVVPVHNYDGTHVVALESVIEVSEAYESSLEEAVKIIKEANQLETDLVCALPANINEFCTVEEFCNLMETLKENNITVSLDKELVCEEFITEAAAFDKLKKAISDALDKMDKSKLEKTIKSAEKNNVDLKAELEKFNDMSSSEQSIYMTKKVVKEIFMVLVVEQATNFAIAHGWGKMASMLFIKGKCTYPQIMNISANIIKPINFATQIINGSLYLNNRAKKGKPFAVTSSTYKQAIKNTIKANDKIIKEAQAKLKKFDK